MNASNPEVEKNVIKKVIDNWDNSGLAFFMALIGAIAFCFASIDNDDWLSVLLQLFGIMVLFLMMWRIPVYYIAKETGVSDKSSASLGLTVCFVILTIMLQIISKRDVFYYFGLCITLTFALLMVWRMNMKDSRVNVRKIFTASTVALLAQCVFSAIAMSDDKAKHASKMALQAALTTILFVVCTLRLIKFLRNRAAIERISLGETGRDDV